MTGNFDFIKAQWPDLHADCARAESYLVSDPRSACFYARRAVEQLVSYVYDVARLPQPYRDDLAARISDPAFRNLAGAGMAQKLTLIRKLGNLAVHETRTVPPRAAVDALRELFHVIVWAAYRYSTGRETVPTAGQFDPALARAAAPLTRDDVVRLAEKFRRQDEAHQRELAQRDDLVKAHEVETARLREQIAAIQKERGVDDHDYNEAETRDRFLDVLLAEAGWLLDDVRDREFPVVGMPVSSGGSGNGFVDYVLWGADGLPLAVIEAKRTKKDPQVGQQQAKLYADCLEQMTGRRPVIFYTNGYEHWLWDDAAGYPPRQVQGFYTRDELELLVQRRTTRLSLVGRSVDPAIVERHYQRHAIVAVRGDLREAAARGPARDGHRVRQDQDCDRTGRPADEGGLGQAGALPGRPDRLGQPGGQRLQAAPADRDDGQSRHREDHRWPGLRLDVPDDDEPDQRDHRRLAAVRARPLRPCRHRRGAPLGLPEVRRDLRVVRLAARGAHRYTQGRGRPQHLSALPARGRRPDRRLQPRPGRRRGLPRAARRCFGAVEVRARGHPVRRPQRRGEGHLGLHRVERGWRGARRDQLR